MKVKEYIDYWYYTYIFANQSPSTAAVNQSHINVHIKPSKLGDMEISQDNNGSGEVIGTIVPRLTGSFTTASEASKYLYCDGSTFSASEYPKLYAILGTNQLPDLRNRFLQGNDMGNTVIEAGLPNITGTYLNNLASMIPDSRGGRGQGAFLDNRANFITYTGGGGSAVVGLQTLTIDASRSNTIYGKSTTVQPPAVTVRYYIRAK